MRIRTQLKNIASYSKGEQINGDDLLSEGTYDYLNGGVSPSGKWNEYNTPGQTVTISEGGNSCGFVNYMNNPFWCGAHCYFLYNTIKNTRYLYYMLKSQQRRLMSIRSGACMPNIKKTDLGKFEIEYDTDEKQQAIVVSVLDRITTIVQSRHQQLQALDDLIKARFVEMFGDPISNPHGWDTYQLNDCLERIDNGKSFVCSDKPRKGIFPAVLKLSAATYGEYRPGENKALLTEEQFVEESEVHSGDLLFTRKNTPELVGMAAYVQKTPPKLMMPDLIFRLVTNEKMNPVFLWQLINCKEFRPIIQGISGGSAKSMSNISKERLGKVSVICPPRWLQDQMIPFVNQIDKSKAVVQKALDEAQLLFDSLMQQYFG